MPTETEQAPRRGRPPQEIVEAHLLEASLQTFASEGFRGARVEEVAQSLGVSKPLLFRRFGTKDRLFEWTIDQEVQVLTERLFSAYEQVEHAPLDEALYAGAEAIVSYATARPDGFRLLFQVGDVGASQSAAVGTKVRAVLTDRMEAIVSRRLARGRAGGGSLSARVLAAAIVGASEHVARRCLEDPQLDPAAATRLLSAILANGLRGLAPEELAAADVPLTSAKAR